jgi:Transglycosylase SLT domain/SPOR domain
MPHARRFPTASWLLLLPLWLAGSVSAAEQPAATNGETPPPTGAATESLCLLLESAASANGLPLEFFVRLIWKESRFVPDAVGPPTRSGARARGIAQFMPGTAAERGLLDPLDPIAALPKSAEFLRDLRGEFGNLGLAAAAYNAGPRRVREWLDGTGGMPAQTRDYVAAITGRSVEDWRGAKDGPLPKKSASCPEMVALLGRAPNAFVASLEQRVSSGIARAWGVQLAAGFSRERVLKTYAALETKYRADLAGTDALVLRGQFRSRGTRDFYQVRIGTDTRTQAMRMCQKLEAAGAACLVLRNWRGAAETIGTSANTGESSPH